MDRKQTGRLGGRVTAAKSPAKAAALRALHSRRRGKRIRPDIRIRPTVLAALAEAVRAAVPTVRSIRVVAAYCRVDERTVRRWLTGEDWPPEIQLRRIQRWLRTQAAG